MTFLHAMTIERFMFKVSKATRNVQWKLKTRTIYYSIFGLPQMH